MIVPGLFVRLCPTGELARNQKSHKPNPSQREGERCRGAILALRWLQAQRSLKNPHVLQQEGMREYEEAVAHLGSSTNERTDAGLVYFAQDASKRQLTGCFAGIISTDADVVSRCTTQNVPVLRYERLAEAIASQECPRNKWPEDHELLLRHIAAVRARTAASSRSSPHP